MEKRTISDVLKSRRKELDMSVDAVCDSSGFVYGLCTAGIGVAIGILIYGIGDIITPMFRVQDAIVSANKNTDKENEQA